MNIVLLVNLIRNGVVAGATLLDIHRVGEGVVPWNDFSFWPLALKIQNLGYFCWAPEKER